MVPAPSIPEGIYTHVYRACILGTSVLRLPTGYHFCPHDIARPDMTALEWAYSDGEGQFNSLWRRGWDGGRTVGRLVLCT